MIEITDRNRGLFAGLAVFLAIAAVSAGLMISWSEQWLKLILLGGMLFIFMAAIFYRNRSIILAVYLLTIVNLDYFRLLSEPFNITIDILFSMALIALAIPLFVTGRLSWKETPIQKGFLFFLGATLICVFLSVDLLVSVKRWFRHVNYFILICLILDTARTRNTVEKFTRIIIYSAVVPCLVGYYGQLARIPSLIGENLRFIYGIDMVRIKSTLSHANTFGLYLGMIIITTIGVLLKSRKHPGISDRIMPLLLLLLTAPMLYFTYSRIGWILTGLATILLLFLQKKWRLLTVFPWLFGLFIWRTSGFVTRWSDIIDTTQPDSLEWRWSLYAYSLRKFIDKPIFGSGPGTFLEFVKFGKGYSQHHLWIGSLVEVGVVGTLAMIVLLVVVWAQLIQCARKKPTGLNLLVLSIFSAFMIVSFAGDPFDVPSVVIYLWALISLALAEYRHIGPMPGNETVAQ